MRLAKECKVAIIEKTYDGGVCLPERSANMSLRGKLVVFWMKHRPRHIATTQMVALMFAAIILLGALLLTLPAASRDGGVLRAAPGAVYGHLCHLRDGTGAVRYLEPVERLRAGRDSVPDPEAADWASCPWRHC